MFPQPQTGSSCCACWLRCKQRCARHSAPPLLPVLVHSRRGGTVPQAPLLEPDDAGACEATRPRASAQAGRRSLARSRMHLVEAIIVHCQWASSPASPGTPSPPRRRVDLPQGPNFSNQAPLRGQLPGRKLVTVAARMSRSASSTDKAAPAKPAAQPADVKATLPISQRSVDLLLSFCE